MLHQRTQKSSASHPQTQQQSSQFAPRPFAIQAQPETQKPATQEEIENEAFNQNKFEANGLQLKEKSGTIAPEEQERLGVLQAKMNDLLVQRQERTSRNGFNLIGIPIHSADAKGNAPIQTKLEQKSDREGEQQQSPQESSETASNEGMDLVQRTFQETNPQSHPVSPIQAKLTIGQPGDKYEQEADSVAAKVVEQINAPASGQSTQGQSVQRQEEDKEEEVQAKPEISALQRMEEPKEEDIQAKLIQKQGDAIGGGEASTDLDTAINSARGGGQPLEAGLQRSMGQAMGADFSGVKVHTDAQADQLNRSVQARAFTTGQDVFFRQGEYNPGSRGGQELIAHELTHVVQQNGGAVQPIQAKMIQMLRYKSDNSPVDINSLSFFRVLDYLKRPDPDPDPGGVIFEADDRVNLQARSASLYTQEFQSLHNFLSTPPVAAEKANRNIPVGVDFPVILREMKARHDAGNLPGFKEWLASVNVNQNALNVVDKINELRSAQNIAGVVNVDETQIPGTPQTADLQHGTSQTEVKTIRQPIKSYTDFTGQVTAALAKFANVNPADGNTYNATIYCSIDQNLISGTTTNKKGTMTHTTINPATLDKITTITRQSDGQPLNRKTENQLNRLLENLNTQNWAGASTTHAIDLIVENGTSHRLVRDNYNQWQRS
ncbi:DUF4157 domain-containing protein [Floridanema aerugineum]|uniref:DUF4157 domain-containing protein n=1 Tax=Floridaenema aerugineum BLCC-F46 TaxID=3153654 RepID=A0ABV4XF46_9CYAN